MIYFTDIYNFYKFQIIYLICVGYLVNYSPNFPGKAWNVGIFLPEYFFLSTFPILDFLNIYHIIFWNCRKMQHLKVIYIFKSQFRTYDFFLRSNLLLIETHYKVIQMNISLMIWKFFISDIINSKNIRSGNNCFPLFSRSYHSHVYFFQPL